MNIIRTNVRTRIARIGTVAILGTVAAIGAAGPAAADFSGDGEIVVADLVAWQRSNQAADDGGVDGHDFVLWRDQASAHQDNAPAADYNLWRSNFGATR